MHDHLINQNGSLILRDIIAGDVEMCFVKNVQIVQLGWIKWVEYIKRDMTLESVKFVKSRL